MTYTGVVSVPRALPRLVRLPSDRHDDFIFLADLVAHHASADVSRLRHCFVGAVSA
jgi:polyphosphate kinase